MWSCVTLPIFLPKDEEVKILITVNFFYTDEIVIKD